MPLVAHGLVVIAPDAECSRMIVAGAWHIHESCLLHEALAVLCSMTAVQRHFSMDSLGHRRRQKPLLRRMLCLMRFAGSSVSCSSVHGLMEATGG